MAAAQVQEAWAILSETVWALPLHEAKAFWYALSEARWARAVAVRQHLGVAVSMQVDLAHLCNTVLAPAVLVAVLEDLVRERLLRRAQATHIEESLLRQVDQHGCYRGEPWDGTERVSTLAPDVVTLAEAGRA